VTAFVHPPSGAIWSAVSAKTIIELVHAGCARSPDKPALIFEDGLTLTRRDLRELVERFAGTLHELIEPGERVAIAMDNRAEYMVAFLAVLANRAAVVPINPASGQADAAHIFRTSRAAVAIVDDAGRTLLASGQDDLPSLRAVLAVEGPEPTGLLADGSRLALADAACRSDDIIAVTFTSGTTGLPKGCMVDHVWALRATDVALRIHSYRPDDRIFYPVKFFYMDALLALLRAMACDGSYVAARRFSVSRFWQVVREHGVTILSTIASMPVWLLKAEPSSADRDHNVRFAIQAHIPAEMHDEMDRRWGFPWLENYGMTEAGLIARVPVELADQLRGTGSAGPPAPEVLVRIVDEVYRDLPAGQVGEILVRQPGMFRGYLDNPVATAELVHDGWICTGDLGRLDERGYVYVVGRKKDVIRRSGENISAAEVEAILCSHPRILDAAVVGVPDRDRGEELKAYVQPIDGASPKDVPPEEIVEFCAARLAPYKIPRYIEYVGEFLRTPSMRIRKEILKQRGDPVAEAWDRRTGEWGKAPG